MAIYRVEIKDFLVFKGEFSADFCSGVNVFIGANGTGKTTLLKALYAATDNIKNYASSYFDGIEDIGRFISTITSQSTADFDQMESHDHNYLPIKVFLVRSTEWQKIENEFYSNISDIASHSEKGIALNAEYLSNPIAFNVTQKSVLIPATEMLSHSNGLLPLIYERKMPFDQTEIDILVKGQFPETRNITPNAMRVLDSIKNIIGGEVLYENDTFYILSDRGKIPFPLEASGYRKFGLLWKLLRNGFLESGTVLFWDEPENSLNPELIPTLVDILLELQRGGVQIFLATHSEILASYFDAIKNKEDKVMFYSLYKDGRQIKHDSSDRFDLLAPNKLTEATADLYEKEVERGLGDDGYRSIPAL
jgi:AAA15 family ATPase/GTPase